MALVLRENSGKGLKLKKLNIYRFTILPQLHINNQERTKRTNQKTKILTRLTRKAIYTSIIT